MVCNESDLRGSVEVTWTVRHLRALSVVTEGWSPEEREALRRGDSDSRDALIEAVWLDGFLGGFTDVDDDMVDLRISEPLADPLPGTRKP